MTLETAIAKSSDDIKNHIDNLAQEMLYWQDRAEAMESLADHWEHIADIKSRVIDIHKEGYQ